MLLISAFITETPIRKTDKNFLAVEWDMYHLCVISSPTFFSIALFYIVFSSTQALIADMRASLEPQRKWIITAFSYRAWLSNASCKAHASILRTIQHSTLDCAISQESSGELCFHQSHKHKLQGTPAGKKNALLNLFIGRSCSPVQRASCSQDPLWSQQ